MPISQLIFFIKKYVVYLLIVNDNNNIFLKLKIICSNIK